MACNANKATFTTLGTGRFPVFKAEWHGKQKVIKVMSPSAHQNHQIIINCLYHATQHSALPASIKNYINPTHLKPTNGIVRETAHAIIRDKKADAPLEQARAIYDWVINNAQYDENTRGRGQGNVKSMLERDELSGKCVDINSLFVALAKAANIPARNQYGIRISESKLHPSIGEYVDISQSQHCRAEFFFAGRGWIPVNPADILQVSKLENIALDDPQITRLREQFFGSWEMNWLTFNHADDLTLFPPNTGKIPFFMYPYAEIDGQSDENLDPIIFLTK